jgi:hypothetical protein
MGTREYETCLSKVSRTALFGISALFAISRDHFQLKGGKSKHVVESVNVSSV